MIMVHRNCSFGTASIVSMSLILLVGCAQGTRSVQMGPSAEVTFDGLHRVDNTGRIDAWVKPNISLAKYSKILPVDTGVRYRTVQNRGRSATEFEIGERQRSRLEEILREAFSEELRASEHFTFADTPGPDVVVLRAGLIDVVSNVPEEGPGPERIFISTIGAATLVIELQDSMSGEILARATERRTAEPAGDLQLSTRAGNLATIRREARRWGRSLREALDELHEL